MVETMEINIKRQNPKVSDNAKTPQEQLAETIGISVDTLNNYKKLIEMCRKHNIDYLIEELDFGEDATIIDVMQWMISHQQARRNMSPGELIYANSMIANEIALENEERKRKGNSLGGKGGYKKEVAVQMDGNSNDDKKSHTSPTHTREQVAKMSGVGTGTVARYDAVMKSDDEELKKKVLADEVKINTAYEKVREQEKKKENINNEQQISQPKTYQNDSQIRFETEKYIV